jgi:hypothetical protein
MYEVRIGNILAKNKGIDAILGMETKSSAIIKTTTRNHQKRVGCPFSTQHFEFFRPVPAALLTTSKPEFGLSPCPHNY